MLSCGLTKKKDCFQASSFGSDTPSKMLVAILMKAVAKCTICSEESQKALGVSDKTFRSRNYEST